MRRLLCKYQAVTEHPDGPVELSAEYWEKLLKPCRIHFSTLPELLKEYLTEALFEKALPLTYELYSAPYLEKFITDGGWFREAARGGLFIIGNRDGDFVCVSCSDGEVALVPGWSISEKFFDREKRYKSLETFFRGQLKREAKAKESAAASKRADAEFAVSTDPNVVDAKGHTTLMNSVGDLEAMKRELDAGAKPNIRSKRTTRTALNLAVKKQHAEGVDLLLNYRPKKFKTNIDNPCSDGSTPLFDAIKKGNFEIVQLLVEAGADLEKTAYRGERPLYAAVCRDHVEIAEYLLQKGADPNALSEGLHPLRMATDKLPMLKLLLKHGADPNDIEIERPLAHLSFVEDALAVLKVFMEEDGIDLNDPRDGLLHMGETPEWTALLCEAGADPNLENKDGALPLMKVLQATHDSPEERKSNALERARILLQHGADPNRLGSGRWNTTPLNDVTGRKFFEGMELLLEHGADPNLPPEKNAYQTAREITNKRWSKKALRVLEAAGAD